MPGSGTEGAVVLSLVIAVSSGSQGLCAKQVLKDVSPSFRCRELGRKTKGEEETSPKVES